LSNNEGRTRRELLTDAGKAAAAATVAGVAGCFRSSDNQKPDAGAKIDAGSRCSIADGGSAGQTGMPKTVSPAVVEVMREDSLAVGTKAQILPDVVAEMLNAGIDALAEQVRSFASQAALDAGTDEVPTGNPGLDGGVANPWTTLLPKYQPGQRIGIKVNCLGVVATSPALVRALIASLRDRLGVDPKNIVVWDRYLLDLTGNGKYTEEDLAGARAIGNLLHGPDPTKGENEDDPSLTDGHGYGDSICEAPRGQVATDNSAGSFPRLSRILTDETDFTINCTVFKSHNVSGITGALKSAYGMIHNPGEYHTDFDIVSPLLYAIPAVRNSLPLTICDAILGVMLGNPVSPANCTPRRIFLAQDPVAMDSYVLDFMNQLLAEKGGRSVVPSPVPWLDRAATLGLGSRSYQLTKV
jgi:hypothetical protein